jgi:UDP-GlcNAc3NAcA epimerase
MPEEINRVVTDHVSDTLFCPTQTSVDNLIQEGISTGIYHVGDVMYDCILFNAKKTKPIKQGILDKLDIRSKSYYLATVHRAENSDDCDRLIGIFEALNEIAAIDCPVVLPLHPRTVKYAHKHSLEFVTCVKVI